VSLVPRLTTKDPPSRLSPMPTRELLLSPLHTTTTASPRRPYLREKGV
jgi:hypothetical protein